MNAKTFNKPVSTLDLDALVIDLSDEKGMAVLITAYKQVHGTAPTLSEDVIGDMWSELPDPVIASEFISQIRDAETRSDADDAKEAKEGKATKTKSVSVRNSDATRLGHELGGNAEFVEALHESIETEKKKRRNTAAVAYALSKAIAKQDLLGMPIPGLAKDDPTRGNKPYDTRPMSEGGGSYWGDVFDGTPDGIDIAGTLAGVQAAIDGTTEAPKMYTGWDEDLLAKTKKSIQADRTAGVRILKSAVNALLRMADIEANTELGVEFISKKVADKVVLVPGTDITVQVFYRAPIEGKDGQFERIRSYWTLGKFMAVKLENVYDKTTAAEQFAAFKPTRAVGALEDNDVDMKNYKQLASAIPAIFWVLDDAEEKTNFVKFLKSDPGKETLSKLMKVNRQFNLILENQVMREIARKLEAEASEAAVA